VHVLISYQEIYVDTSPSTVHIFRSQIPTVSFLFSHLITLYMTNQGYHYINNESTSVFVITQFKPHSDSVLSFKDKCHQIHPTADYKMYRQPHGLELTMGRFQETMLQIPQIFVLISNNSLTDICILSYGFTICAFV